MAVDPKLGDQEIVSLIEIPPPSTSRGQSSR